MRREYIVDNRRATMAKELRECCRGTHTLHIAVGYFYVDGFNILRDRLDSIGKIRLVMGNQTDKPTATDLKRGHEEAIREQIVRNLNNVSDGPEAETLLELYEYIREARMGVRIYVKNRFHAKAYVFERDEPYTDVAFVGSSNLSGPGLGNEGGNVELNIQSRDTPVVDALLKWYDEIWNDALPYSEELIRIIEHTVPYARKQNDLEFVTPKELFKIMAAEMLDDWDEFADESVDLLAEFQKIGVLNASDKIRKFGGCIVADSVGLGKTFIGMELIREAQARGQNALVIVPKNVEQNWQRELEKYGSVMLDEPRLKIMTIDRLSRMDLGLPDDYAELESLKKRYDFIVIDEAHRFRNKGYYAEGYSNNRNYANLRILKEANTRYLLLTATPLNNTVKDLENLISIFTTETRLKNTNPELDFFHFGEYDKIAGQIKKLEKDDPAYDNKLRSLIELRKPHELGIKNILEEVVVLRTRSDINERYSNEVIGGKRVSFIPITVEPNRCKFPPSYMQLYESVVDLLAQLNVPHMVMKTGGTVQLQGLYMTLLYKRLESSIHSFVRTLETLVETEEELLTATEQHGWKEAAKGKRIDDEGLDEYGFETKHDETMQDKEAMAKLREDIHMVKEFIGKHVGPIRKGWGYVDPKLDMLLEMLQSETGKVLVFTQYRDTAKYLYDNIRDIGKTVDCVSGTGDLGTNLDTHMKVKLFAPIANNYEPTTEDREIDILVSTDTLSEGVNLQDCGVVVNYDIPWNPMRMVQRAGRSDRIGSKTKTTVRNILPDAKFDELFLGLLDKVAGKITTIIDILGTENQIVTDEEDASPKTIGEAIRKMGDPGDVNAYEKMGRNPLFKNIRTNEKMSEMMLKIQERVRNLGSVRDYKKRDGVMYSAVMARKTDRKGVFMMFRVVDAAQDEKMNDIIIFRDSDGKFSEVGIDDFLTSIPMDEFEEGILRTDGMERALEAIEEYFKANRFREIQDAFNPARMGTLAKADRVQELVMRRLDRIIANKSLDEDADGAAGLYESLAEVVLRSSEVSLLKKCFGGTNIRDNIHNMPKGRFIEVVADFYRRHVRDSPNYHRQRRSGNISYEKICWGAFD